MPRQTKKRGELSLRHDQINGRVLRINVQLTDYNAFGEETGDSLSIDLLTWLHEQARGRYKSDRELLNDALNASAAYFQSGGSLPQTSASLITKELIEAAQLVSEETKKLQSVSDELYKLQEQLTNIEMPDASRRFINEKLEKVTNRIQVASGASKAGGNSVISDFDEDDL